MKKPKIIYYSPHPTHDIVSEVGYATHQRETILALQALGCEVIPLILGGSSREDLKFNAGKAKDHSGMKKWVKRLIPRFVWISLKDLALMKHDRRAAKRLETAILEHVPDLVYERSELLQDASVAVIRKYKTPYFVEVNAPFIEEMRKLEGFSMMHLIAGKKERNKYKAADKIYTVSTALKKFLISEYGVQAQKIRVAPNRINAANFPLQSPEPHAGTVVGFVGSILPFHRIDRLIEAVSMAAEMHEISLLIVGEGAQITELQEMATRLGLGDKVKFMGRVPHDKVYAQIAKMDICVMPGSNWYQSPVKIFEYAAMGKSIIGPKDSPLEDIMVHGRDGYLVEQQVEALSKGIVWMIEHKSEAEEMGRHFSEKIREKYTWKHAAEEILEDYRALTPTIP